MAMGGSERASRTMVDVCLMPPPIALLAWVAWLLMGCSPDPVPSMQKLQLAWQGKRLPGPRAVAPKELIQELAESFQTSVQSQREFRHWPCDVGSTHRLKDSAGGSFYLSCALAGFHQPRVLVLDTNVATTSDAGRALAHVDHNDRISVSGAFEEGRHHWGHVTVENSGLDLKVAAESAIFIRVDVQQVKR